MQTRNGSWLYQINKNKKRHCVFYTVYMYVGPILKCVYILPLLKLENQKKQLNNGTAPSYNVLCVLKYMSWNKGAF